MAITENQRAARALGRLGGLKGGRARSQALSPERRKEIAQNAIAARWKKGAAPSATDPVPPVAAPGQLTFPAGDFFSPKTIGEIIAGQNVLPVPHLSIFAGVIPDEDVDAFVAQIYRDR